MRGKRTSQKKLPHYLAPLSKSEIERRRLDAIARQSAKVEELPPSRTLKTSNRRSSQEVVDRAKAKRKATESTKNPKPGKARKINVPPDFTPDEAIALSILDAVERLDEPGGYAVKNAVCAESGCGAGRVYDHINWLLLQGKLMRTHRFILFVPDESAKKESDPQ